MTSNAEVDRHPVALRTDRMATGGEAVARLDDGRVIFVRGALPGELVHVQLTEQKKRFCRGIAVDVVEPSTSRIEPACAHAATGQCGGCDWIMVEAQAQGELKQAIVTEQLQRLGGIDAPAVTTTPSTRGRRTTVRCAVVDGRAGYRERRGSVTFAAASCQAAHPLVEELIVDGRFANASEVIIRVGAATGDRLVITDGDVASVHVPDDVVVIASDGVAGSDVAITEIIADREWKISANSFFQTSPEGAETLVAATARQLASSTGSVVDLYGGVGLLGGGAVPGRVQCMVESNPSSARDAVANLGPNVNVIQERVERWTPSSFDAVIADPARRGLRADGVAAIESTGATHLVLVSCDPASLGRDASLLSERGWRFQQAELIDMFPDTSRIEVVSTFIR